MIIFTLIEAILILLGLYILVTQLIMPILKGTPIFAGFRKSKVDVQEDIEEIKELLEIVELEKEKKNLEAKLPTNKEQI